MKIMKILNSISNSFRTESYSRKKHMIYIIFLMAELKGNREREMRWETSHSICIYRLIGYLNLFSVSKKAAVKIPFFYQIHFLQNPPIIHFLYFYKVVFIF